MPDDEGRTYIMRRTGRNQVVTETEGYIVSHAKYGKEKYKNRIDSQLTISGLHAGLTHSIQLEFLTFELQDPHQKWGCNRDYLKINKTSYCGQMLKQTTKVYNTTESTFTLRFHTDRTVKRNGFKIQFSSKYEISFNKR